MDNQWWREFVEKRILTAGGTVAMKISVESSQKAINKSIIVSPCYNTPWHMLRGLDILLHGYLFSHVRCSSIHSG